MNLQSFEQAVGLYECCIEYYQNHGSRVDFLTFQMHVYFSQNYLVGTTKGHIGHLKIDWKFHPKS